MSLISLKTKLEKWATQEPLRDNDGEICSFGKGLEILKQFKKDAYIVKMDGREYLVKDDEVKRGNCLVVRIYTTYPVLQAYQDLEEYYKLKYDKPTKEKGDGKKKVISKRRKPRD